MATKHPDPVALASAIRDIALRIGQSSEDIVLVGGQSVLFWADELNIPVPSNIPLLTDDVDFIAGMGEITDAESSISPIFETKLYLASMDDTSPNSGKMTINYPLVGKINVDFLRMITGLDANEVARDSFPLRIDGHLIHVISPIMLVRSKISNIGMHLNKRNEEGIAQGKLALEIARKYLELKVHGNDKPPYINFEELIRFARSDPASYAFKFHGLDVLSALPVSALRPDDPFLIKRYPVAIAQIAIRRQKFDDMVERMAQFDNNAESSRFHP